MTKNTQTPIEQAIEALEFYTPYGIHVIDETIINLTGGVVQNEYELDSGMRAVKALETLKAFLPTLAELTKLAEAVQWKAVVGWEEYYEVNGLGFIKRLNGPIIGQWEKRGYYKVKLSNPRKDIYAHRIVAEAFIPNPDNKPFVNHIDCNPLNNHYTNLEWCTQAENVKHSRALGRYPNTYWKGKRNHRAKLTDDQVRQIRNLANEGISQRDIASEIGASRRTVQKILKGEYYSYVN